MQKFLITLALFTPFVRTFPSSNSIINASGDGRHRVVFQGEEFKGRHACAVNSVCDCWYEEKDSWMEVDCSNRNLTDPPKSLTGLFVDDLNLADNLLEQAPDMTKNGFEFVRNLNLMGNRIKNVSEKFITPKLEILNLKYNRIACIKGKVFKELRKLTNLMLLRIDHNPLICDCKSKNSYKILQRIRVVGPYQAMCAGSNKRIVDLKLEELCPNATILSLFRK